MNNQKSDDFALRIQPETPNDKAFEILSQENEQLKAEKNTIIFMWVISIIILLDSYIFSKYDTWSAPIALLILELGLLFILGTLLKIDSFLTFIGNMMQSLKSIVNK